MYLPNKYTTWYLSIISNASKKTLVEEYTEIHHIIPKSLGGSNDPDNLVRLTAREHFICHMLLTKMVEGNAKQKMIYAWWAMVNQNRPDQQRYKVSSRIYNIVREAAARNHRHFKHSIDSKKRIGSAHKGKVVTEETRQKMRDIAKNRSLEHYAKAAETRRKNQYTASEETRLKISQALTGRKRILTEEHKKNIAIAARNRVKK